MNGPDEKAVSHEPVERFSAPETVAEYAATPSLQGAEELLFSRHIERGSAILDLGVGAGRTTHFLQPVAGRYVGVDISAAMLDAARKSYPQSDFRLADASDLGQFVDHSFDVVVFSYNGLGFVLPDARRLKCLAECARVLKREGVLIFSLHNARSIFVRPGRQAAGLAGLIGGMSAGLNENLKRFATRVLSATFWQGQGCYWTSAHGGMKVFASIPGHVARELEGVDFRLIEVAPENFPRPARALVTRWYYYAFRRA